MFWELDGRVGPCFWVLWGHTFWELYSRVGHVSGYCSPVPESVGAIGHVRIV